MNITIPKLKTRLKKLDDDQLKGLKQIHSSLLSSIFKELVELELEDIINKEPQADSTPYLDSYIQGKRKGFIQGISAYSKLSEYVEEELGIRRKSKIDKEGKA